MCVGGNVTPSDVHGIKVPRVHLNSSEGHKKTLWSKKREGVLCGAVGNGASCCKLGDGYVV